MTWRRVAMGNVCRKHVRVGSDHGRTHAQEHDSDSDHCTECQVRKYGDQMYLTVSYLKGDYIIGWVYMLGAAAFTI